MRIVIVGAGYTGQRLAGVARRGGWDVLATTRSVERSMRLEALGGRAVSWRAEDGLGGLNAVIEPGDVIVWSVPPTKPGMELKAALAAREAGARRFIYLSSTSVYGDHEGRWVDEDSQRNPISAAGKARKEIEDALLGLDWSTNVVRIVGIYGPGSEAHDERNGSQRSEEPKRRTLYDYIAAGRYALVDGGHRPTNRIHVDDLARVILAVAERAPEGPRAYIASDGTPTPVRELVDWFVEHLGMERPPEPSLGEYEASRGARAADRWRSSYRASNRRICEELGVELLYPDAFAGYAAIFEDRLQDQP